MVKVSNKVSKATKTAPVASVLQTRTMEPHEIVLSPSLQNAVGVLSWSKFAGEADLGELVKDLREQVKNVADGDMRPVEAMLYGQALALQTMFTSLSRRAAANDNLKPYQVNLTLALKAQAQCRATLEALAEIKNPRSVSFVKQANIAQQQQVNNAATSEDSRSMVSSKVSSKVSSESGTVRAGAPAHAEENAGVKNELLEAPHGQRLDTGAQGTAGSADQGLETVGTSQRTAVG